MEEVSMSGAIQENAEVEVKKLKTTIQNFLKKKGYMDLDAEHFEDRLEIKLGDLAAKDLDGKNRNLDKLKDELETLFTELKDNKTYKYIWPNWVDDGDRLVIDIEDEFGNNGEPLQKQEAPSWMEESICLIDGKAYGYVNEATQHAIDVIVDVLTNDEYAYDDEIVDLLHKETKISKQKLSSLVKQLRHQLMGKVIFKDKADEMVKKELKEDADDNKKIIDAAVALLGEENKEKIVDTIKESGNGFFFEAEEGEYLAFLSQEDAEKEATSQLKDLIDSEGVHIFSQDFVKQYVYIDDVTKRQIALDDADARATDFRYDLEQQSYDTLIEDLDSQIDEKKTQALIDEVEALESEYLDADGQKSDQLKVKLDAKRKELEAVFNKAIDEWSDDHAEEVEKSLKNPIKYFVDEQGIYSLEDLLKADFISVNEDEMIKDAIDIDGVEHTLAGYDHEELEKNGVLFYRTN